MNVSVVIVTYNSQTHIEKCINSLYRDCYDKQSFEIVIIDNDSKDRTLAILTKLKDQYKNIKILPQLENLGFTKGCNLGVRESNNELILFLNPDTESRTKDWDKILLARHEPNGITGFNFYFDDGKPQFPIGRFPFKIHRIIFDKLPYLRKRFGVLVRDEKFYNIKRKVDWVCGCGLIIPKKIFNKLNGFDENIFMYWDETDLCYRAHLSGFSTWYIPYIVFIHSETGDDLDRKPHKRYQIRKNLLYLFKKYNMPYRRLIFLIITKLEKTLAFFYLISFLKLER